MTGWTKGEWFLHDMYGFVCAKNDLSTLVIADVSGRTRDEIKANNQLLLEAGTVANETGLSPRQLVDQRAELLAALKLVADTYGFDPSIDSSIWQTVFAAIERVTS